MSKHLVFALSASSLMALAACGKAEQPAAPEQADNMEVAAPEAPPAETATGDGASEASAEPATKAPEAALPKSEPKAAAAKPKPATTQKAPAGPLTKTTPPPAEPDPHAGHDMDDMK